MICKFQLRQNRLCLSYTAVEMMINHGHMRECKEYRELSGRATQEESGAAESAERKPSVIDRSTRYGYHTHMDKAICTIARR